MKIQNESLELSTENQEVDASTKKEWNAPEIKVVAPISRTAGGPDLNVIVGENADYRAS